MFPFLLRGLCKRVKLTHSSHLSFPVRFTSTIQDSIFVSVHEDHEANEDRVATLVDNRHPDLPLGSSILLTCEHATNYLPRPYGWGEDDKWLQDTHWAYDPGAAELTNSLCEKLGTVAGKKRNAPGIPIGITSD